MKAVVVDASVAIKWFVPEALSPEAEGFLDGSFDLTAPDLLLAEVGNVLWKKTARGEIRAAEGREILQALDQVPLRLVPSGDLVTAAFDIANAYGRTVYDSMYVALAVACDGVMVTADERLARAMGSGELAGHVRFLGPNETSGRRGHR